MAYKIEKAFYSNSTQSKPACLWDRYVANENRATSKEKMQLGLSVTCPLVLLIVILAMVQVTGEEFLGSYGLH